MGHEFVLTCLVGRAFPVASVTFALRTVGVAVALVPTIVAVFSLIQMLHDSTKGTNVRKKLLDWLLSLQTFPEPSVGDVSYRFFSVRNLAMLFCKNDAEPYKCKEWSKKLSVYSESSLCCSLRELNLVVSDEYRAHLNDRGKLNE